MAKKTAIIDLGSNGVRMAIYERTSRFGFYILHEQKVKFQLAQNQSPKREICEKNIEKLIQILNYFKDIARDFGVRKFLVVGTSALRDASNQKQIKAQVFAQTKLNIKTLSGEQEAMLGGFGATELLPEIPRAICLDIGGGSAELSLFEQGALISTCSLDIGTVRLKDIFESSLKECEKIIDKALNSIPKEFACAQLISIGGSLRAISSSIMQQTNYPLKSVHGFSYKYKNHENFIKQLYKGGELIGIKKERFDTIRIGALVFAKIIAHLGVSDIITSGAGVREGVFLRSILGKHKRLPKHFNPSLKSLEDRFIKSNSSACVMNAKRMFNALAKVHFLKPPMLENLTIAARLAHIGKHLSFYSKHAHAAYFVRAGLNFRIRHEDKALISTIIELHGKKFTANKLELAGLLPDEMSIMWLNFILAFCRILCTDRQLCDFSLEDECLCVSKKYLNPQVFERLRKIYRPKWLQISLNGTLLDE